MKTLFVRFVKDELGVTAIEYGLIAGLISVVIIVARHGNRHQASQGVVRRHRRCSRPARKPKHFSDWRSELGGGLSPGLPGSGSCRGSCSPRSSPV